MKKILVIGHDASRTGGPILLLRLLSLLEEKYEINIVLNRSGPLEDEFRKIGKTVVFPMGYWNYSKSKSFIVKLFNYLLQPVRTFFFLKTFKKISSNADLIFVNTITNGALLKRLTINVPVVCYIHELEYIITTYNKKNDVNFLIDKTNLFLVPCNTVKKHLQNFYEIPSSKIKHLHYYIEALQNPINQAEVKTNHSFTIMGSGTSDWRKGFDLFYQTAFCLKQLRKNNDFTFIWVGCNENDPMVIQAKYDLAKLGLKDCVKFVGQVNNLSEYLELADIFYLPSREDPYPLVVLEAASNGLPTICFDKGGGIVDFVEQDAGKIVSYLNLTETANAINDMMENPLLLNKMGKNAKEKVRAMHNKNVVIDELKNIFSEVNFN